MTSYAKQLTLPPDDQPDCGECRGLGCNWCGHKGYTRDPLPRQPRLRKGWRTETEFSRRLLEQKS